MATDFGDYLDSRMRASGLTAAELARRAKLHHNTIWRYRHSKTPPSLTKRRAIARALGETVEAFDQGYAKGEPGSSPAELPRDVLQALAVEAVDAGPIPASSIAHLGAMVLMGENQTVRRQLVRWWAHAEKRRPSPTEVRTVLRSIRRDLAARAAEAELEDRYPLAVSELRKSQ